ncbi:hypothetical protein [Parapedobacter tibetensis]|uniref:hypothetical protein n=1 Tax=Parapedobacter tibetensis TaxID=2972951 RepID=UPI00214DA448|nr:hypothetical protein [Parapedobacter tibetensis]
MDKQTLINRLATTLTKTKVPDLATLGEDTIPVVLLHEVCFYEKNESIAFRAAWVLEYIAIQYPESFMPAFHNFIDHLHDQRNSSCQRHFTKILMQITHPRTSMPFQGVYKGIDRARLVEIVFEWLIDPDTPVAVQVNCMDILFNMSKEFSWIRDELKNQVEFFMRDGSAAMQSRGKKILDKLKKSKPEVDPNG